MSISKIYLFEGVQKIWLEHNTYWNVEIESIVNVLISRAFDDEVATTGRPTCITGFGPSLFGFIYVFS